MSQSPGTTAEMMEPTDHLQRIKDAMTITREARLAVSYVVSYREYHYEYFMELGADGDKEVAYFMQPLYKATRFDTVEEAEDALEDALRKTDVSHIRERIYFIQTIAEWEEPPAQTETGEKQ